ncbi:hypothetical protein EYZ11_013310 [Aspergillus tanneri]|uniref:Uncharacterized protein n=1 Tax=Aspergillus tanneri TaxID=1220188 RepID=A0A4V6RQL7_9EURO|nr:hypothetical protein EYZ11_013310 [Aspergillus tanneri]
MTLYNLRGFTPLTAHYWVSEGTENGGARRGRAEPPRSGLRFQGDSASLIPTGSQGRGTGIYGDWRNGGDAETSDATYV